MYLSLDLDTIEAKIQDPDPNSIYSDSMTLFSGPKN